MSVKILLYRGKSLISKAIQWQTRSPYSHAAIALDDGYIGSTPVYEAWHIGGVAKNPNPFAVHTPGTPIDAFVVEGVNLDLDAMRRWADAQVGKGYDFVSVFRFVTRRQAPHNSKWFCSELVEAICRAGNGNAPVLLRGEPSLMSPRDLSMSPRLRYIGRI